MVNDNNDNQPIIKSPKLKNNLHNNNNAMVKFYSFKKINLLNIGSGFFFAINKASEEFLQMRPQAIKIVSVDIKKRKK
jgi:hypothetical protein